jgi:hypothetical protein
VGRLLAEAARLGDRVTIITFNHDLVIENEIFRRQRLSRRWCLARGYGTISEKLDPLEWNVPSFPTHDEDCDHARPLTILKLHGSLNWVVTMRAQRPTAALLSGGGGERELSLLPARVAYPRGIVRTRARRGRTSWYLWPVVIPPVYAKQTLRKLILPVWEDAANAIRSCDRIAFFGYSLPQLDVEAEKLFERGITANRALSRVDVINSSPDSAQRYATLTPRRPIRWYPTIDGFLEAHGLE